MFNSLNYVPANEIWPNAQSFIDYGHAPGLLRGYNVEVIDKNGETHWESCEYIHGEPQKELFDEFHTYYYTDRGYTPTGRISFRGYGREEYDPDERDTYIIPVEVRT